MNTPQPYDPIIHYARSRIEELKRHPLSSTEDIARIYELTSIIAFCQVLHSQEEFLERALKGVMHV